MLAAIAAEGGSIVRGLARVCALAAGVVAAALLPVLPAAPASASGGSVTFAGLPAGPTAGALNFDVVLGASPDEGGPSRLVVRIGHPAYGPVLADVNLNGVCTSGCTVPVSYDTAPLPESPAAMYALADGTQQITATATWSPTTTQTTASVVLDNHRPTVTLDDEIGDPSYPWGYGITARDTLTVHASALPGSGSSPIDRVVLRTQAGFGKPIVLTPLVRQGDGSWTAVLDTSAWASATYTGTLFAVDAAGVTSVAVDVPIAVDHGLTLQPPAILDQYDTVGQLIRFGPPPGLPAVPARPLTYTVTVDGEPWVTDGLALDFAQSSFVVQASSVLTPGPHTLHLSVVDTRGVPADVTYDVVITGTASFTWSVPEGPVPFGRPVTITNGITLTRTSPTAAAVTFSPSNGVAANDLVPCPFPCPQTTTLTSTWTPTALGTFRPQLTVRGHASGSFAPTWNSVSDSTIEVLPVAEPTLRLPRYGVVGRPTSLSVRVDVTAAGPAAGRQVRIERRLPGETIWRLTGVVTTGSDGVATMPFTPASTAQWRAVTAGTTGIFGAASTPQTFRPLPAVRATVPSTARARVPFTVSVTALGVPDGARGSVQVYVAGYWRTVAGLTFARSAAKASVTLSTSGTKLVRVLIPQNVRTATWLSSERRVLVR
ncbi:MAG: hypothetical protein AB7I24_16655 [Candidatus Nanopelagicales bacterium]